MGLYGDSAMRVSADPANTGLPVQPGGLNDPDRRPERGPVMTRIAPAGASPARDFRIYNGIPGMLSVIDDSDVLVAVSDHWLKVMGYGRDEVIGTHRSRYLTPEAMDRVRTVLLPEMERTGYADGVELTMVRKDGSPLPVLVSVRFEIDPGSGQRSSIAVAIDRSEREAAERALRDSEARFRALFENASDLTCVVEGTGIVKLVSPSVQDVMGYSVSEVVGRSLFDFIHPDEVDGWRDSLASLQAKPGCVEHGEARARTRDGNWRSFAWSARSSVNVTGIDGIMVSARDMTQFRRLEAQLGDARRLQTIGALAGGIAHDVNNILGAILGFAKFLCEDLPGNTPQHTYADRIVTAGERGRDLIHQIFAFSRAGRVERQPEDVVALAQETVRALPALLPDHVHLTVRLEHRPLVARVNAAQIQQVLMNLTLNARDALQGEHGQVEIEIAEVPAEDPEYRRLGFYEGNGVHAAQQGGDEIVLGALEPAGRFVRITVTDTGVGMTSEIMGSAFEPFFTTKSRASGTGLGLATVRNIVSAAGGSCVMRSQTGQGTTVSIWLPLIEIDAPAAIGAPEAAVRTGQGRILVVDDESDLADATAIGLRRLGYEAVAFNDPAEALRQFSKDPHAWRSVISDHRMPGLTGLQLLKAMQRVDPKVDFILCSGYTDSMVEHAAFDQGASHFFLKPVDVKNLATAIEADAGRRTGAAAQ